MDTLEGFFVNKPYWVFENLSIRGVCTSDSRCEHAFHVVGNGVGTVLRNNELIDFNAALKVNGLRAKKPEQHPDFGLVQNNTIYNTRPRNTGNPTTPLNINTANGWVVSSNFIADFAKGKSDRISYAAFMKGNSSNGVFERNLVVCHWKLPMDGGIRIGLSFGGGGTGRQFCRWGDCRAEHTAGIIRNNIITRCPADVGIYLNRSARTQIYGNLLLNNKGIDVRFSSSSASIHNNIIDGRILDREGGKHTSDNNLMSSDCSVLSLWFGDCSVARFYRDSASGDFQLIDIDAILDRGSQDMQAGTDFCGNHRDHLPDIGPIEYGINSTCLADLTSAPPEKDPIPVD